MEENKHNISVALATYNGAKFLYEQLFSIINQTYPPKEIIVVDDFSTDSTVQIIEEVQKDFPFIKLYVNNQNRGPVTTFEIVISKCNCNYIALCDQDDIWEVNKLELSLSELRAVEEENVPSMVFTDLMMIDSVGNLDGKTFWGSQGLNPSKMDFYKTLFLNSVTGCTVIFNRSMKDELINIPKGVEMHDYWIALIALGLGNCKPLFISTVKYRAHDNSVTVKDGISYAKRVKKFVRILFGLDMDYMENNFRQANLFLDIYGNRLSNEKRKQLINFIKLNKKSTFIKNIYIGYFKYFYIYK
jgi:glycosyltransferase involved in cell wall biosynthesis